MTSIYGGKVVGEDEESLIVLIDSQETCKIPKHRVVEVIGVDDPENFLCVGREVSILHDDEGEFHLKFYGKLSNSAKEYSVSFLAGSCSTRLES